MKTKIFSLGLVVAVLTSSILGCGAKVSPLVEFVKLLPNDTNTIVYIDVSTMSKDPDLADMYDSLQDEWVGFEEDFGIALPSVNILAIAYYEDGAAVVIKGDFDFDSVHNALRNQESQGFAEDEYKSVEVWIGKDYTVAFPDGMYVMGSSLDTVKNFIELSQGDGTSMYDDEHVKSIVDRLPAGINTLLQNEDVVSIGGVQYLAGGISLIKSSSIEGTLELKGWYKFGSAADAEAGLADLEDYLKHVFDATNVSSQLNGEFIELTGEAELDVIQIFF